MFKKLILPILVTAAFNSVAGTTYKVDTHELPYSSEVVDQYQYVNMPSYQSQPAGTRWWMCGHAAFATAMNVLRNKPADDANQLEWFHTQLLSYDSYKYNNPSMLASGDHLAEVVSNRNDGFSVRKETNYNRETIKSRLHNALTSSNTQQIIALTQHNSIGHFVVVHEIYYDPNRSDGGQVKYADPLNGRASRSMGYTQFLNGMRDAGTSGLYSFWVMSK